MSYTIVDFWLRRKSNVHVAQNWCRSNHYIWLGNTIFCFFNFSKNYASQFGVAQVLPVFSMNGKIGNFFTSQIIISNTVVLIGTLLECTVPKNFFRVFFIYALSCVARCFLIIVSNLEALFCVFYKVYM